MLPAAAQTTPTTPTEPPTQQQQNPAARAENQQDRIAQGIKDGQLTSSEAAKLENKEAQINKEAQQMKKADGGKLSKQDYQKIEKQQNQLSKQINKDEHNSAVANQNPNPKNVVGQNLENQQDRIAQGVKSGQLTAGEAASLEQKDAQIQHEISTDRAANGGKLTNQERAQIKKQENQVSKQIYKDKHNNVRAHK
jgi:hypothetical protein